MKVKIDIGDLKEFQKRLEDKKKDMDAFAASCVSELGARLMAKVEKRTPVGQYSGIVRFVTSDGKEVSFNVKPKVGGALQKGWKALAPVKWGDSHVVWLYNNVDYAQYVEYGHRIVNRKGEEKGWKEETHMLENSAAELERELDSIISKRLADFLKDLM